MTRFGGTNGQATVPVSPTHETPTTLPAQQSATPDNRGQDAVARSATARGHVSYSDPGDGYDSATRWHADFELDGMR